MAYAKGTEVPIERSKAELKRLVYNKGGSNYKIGEEEKGAIVIFHHSNRYVRFMIPFPARSEFTYTPERRLKRTEPQITKEWEAEQARRWRALILAIKAKFEVVETGIATFEEEFLPHIMLPDGETVAQKTLPSIDQAYTKGVSVNLLPDYTQ